MKWSEVKWSESHSVMSDSLWPRGLYSPWNSPGQNTGVGSLSLLQGLFPNPGIKPRSCTLQADSLPTELQGKPKNTRVGSLSFSSGSSQARSLTVVSCIGDQSLDSLPTELWGKPREQISHTWFRNFQIAKSSVWMKDRRFGIYPLYSSHQPLHPAIFPISPTADKRK